jgi:WD40 repeat protein
MFFSGTTMNIIFPAARLIANSFGRSLAGLFVLAVLVGDVFGQAAAEMRHGQIKCPAKTGYPLVFSPDGKLLAAGSRQRSTISIVDVAATKERVRLQLPGDSYEYQLAFTADGRRLVSAGQQDDMIRVWDVVTGKQVREFKKPMHHCLAIAPGGKRIALTDKHRNTVKLFHADTEQLIAPADPEEGPHKPGPIEAVAFASDGKTFAVHEGLRSPGTPTINVLDLEKGTLIRELQESESKEGGVFRFLTFSPDGKLLAAGGLMNRFGAPDRCLHVWEVQTGKTRLKLQCKNEYGSFSWAAFSPDGSLMVCSSHDGFVLFDLLNGKEICRLPEGGGGVFSPDGALLAVPGQTPERESVITLYNMPKGRNEPLARHLGGDQLEALWRDLAPDNDFRLQRVLASLRAAPEDTVAFLGKKLQPVADAQRQRVQALLLELDDDEPKTREKAMEALQELAAEFEPLLADVSKKHEPGEVCNRVRFVLRRQREAAVPDSLLIRLRAVLVLEQIGTEPARQILSKVAAGPAGARLTVEARQALERLAQASRPK